MADTPRPSAIAIIPARFASTRLPGKPLLAQTGKPMIQHVVEQAGQARTVQRVIVATDDERFHQSVQAFGGESMMTGEHHTNGTSRIAEVVQRLGEDAPADTLLVNVQGDEPEIEPQVIDRLVDGLAADPDAPMATLCSRFAEDEDPHNPNIVKLLRDQLGRAIYFSRSLIPFDRDAQINATVPTATFWKHPGLYAYRRDFLLKYVTLPATPLEEAEKLEQLRAIEHGYRIRVVETVVRHHGIDTPDQYAAFVQRVKAHLSS